MPALVPERSFSKDQIKRVAQILRSAIPFKPIAQANYHRQQATYLTEVIAHMGGSVVHSPKEQRIPPIALRAEGRHFKIMPLPFLVEPSVGNRVIARQLGRALLFCDFHQAGDLILDHGPCPHAEHIDPQSLKFAAALTKPDVEILPPTDLPQELVALLDEKPVKKHSKPKGITAFQLALGIL